MIEIICAVIASLSTVLSAVMVSTVKKNQEKANSRAIRRAEESKLSMDMLFATTSLTLVLAKKLTGQQTNGDVEDAMKSANSCRRQYTDFVREQAANTIIKV